MQNNMEAPTTRQVLQELFENIETQVKSAEDSAYKPGHYDPVSEARASGLKTALAMIVGIENKYGIYD